MFTVCIGLMVVFGAINVWTALFYWWMDLMHRIVLCLRFSRPFFLLISCVLLFWSKNNSVPVLIFHIFLVICFMCVCACTCVCVVWLQMTTNVCVSDPITSFSYYCFSRNAIFCIISQCVHCAFFSLPRNTLCNMNSISHDSPCV
jgi:hypothetical protein